MEIVALVNQGAKHAMFMMDLARKSVLINVKIVITKIIAFARKEKSSIKILVNVYLSSAKTGNFWIRNQISVRCAQKIVLFASTQLDVKNVIQDFTCTK